MFASVLSAFADPEYAIAGMDAFADRLALYLRHAGDTSSALPLSCGDLMVIDKESGYLMLAVHFIWAHTEQALNSLGYRKSTEGFIPLLRDDESAPILRITGLRIDEDQFSEWAFGRDSSPDEFEFVLQFQPSTIDPEWLASQPRAADPDGGDQDAGAVLTV